MVDNLESRLDKYLNSEYSDPLAIGLISELRAHLRAANKAASLLNVRWERTVFKIEPRLAEVEKQIAELKDTTKTKGD